MRLGRLVAAGAGTALMGMLVLLPAAPAGAIPANITIDAPPAGAQLSSTSVAITGHASIDQGLLGSNAITDVSVSVAFEGRAFDSCDNGGCGATTGHASTSYSFTPKSLSRNGPYSVTANVTAFEYLLGSPLAPQTRTGTATTNFNVGVAPAAPRNVKAQVNGDGSVTVSWSPNAEPDLIGYQIERRDSATGPLHVVKDFISQTSWTDTGTAQSGGAFGYVVIAFRPGPTGSTTDASSLMHTTSAPASANVPVPTPPTSPSPQDGGSATTVAVSPSVTSPAASSSSSSSSSSSAGGLDLSGFLAQASKAGAVPPAPTAGSPATPSRPAPALAGGDSSGLPDTYAPTLPYGAAATKPGTTLPASAGSSRASLPARPSSSHGHRSILFSIAGGLLLCVLGAGLRVANRRGDREPLEALGGVVDRTSAAATEQSQLDRHPEPLPVAGWYVTEGNRVDHEAAEAADRVEPAPDVPPPVEAPTAAGWPPGDVDPAPVPERAAVLERATVFRPASVFPPPVGPQGEMAPEPPLVGGPPPVSASGPSAGSPPLLWPEPPPTWSPSPVAPPPLVGTADSVAAGSAPGVGPTTGLAEASSPSGITEESTGPASPPSATGVGGQSPADGGPPTAGGDGEPAPPVLATPLVVDPAAGGLDYFQLLRTAAAEPEVPAPAG